jgi:hypothetical protein
MPAGRHAYERRTESKTAIYSYESEAAELSDAHQTAFTALPAAWRFWQAQAWWYRLTATHR